MKATDEAIWQDQRKELLADGEIGTRFLEILEFWADRTDALTDAGDASLHLAFERAFLDAEEKFGRLGATWNGQLVAVMCIFWHRGLELAQALTPIELRLVQDMASAKITTLAESAAVLPTDEETP
jgi:hypothetical protein